MAQYSPRPSNFQANQVGDLYHLGLSDGTVAYGYVLQNHGGGDDRSALNESTNITDRDKLIQISSPSLIDQHLVIYPRVSQGDYTGGQGQVVFLDATRYFDSDLDTHTPGYLQLRPSWTRTTKSLSSPGGYTQVIPWNSDVWFSFSEPSGNVYSLAGGTSTSPGFQVIGLDTDGNSMYAGGTGNLSLTTSGSSWTTVASALNGTAKKWWLVNQGTNGRFAYYSIVAGTGFDSLYKIDTTASFPVAAGSQPQVPTGSNPIHIVDVAPYQNGIAILSSDPTGIDGFDVWFHDGANMTRIVRVEGYLARGMCNALGDLYVSAQSSKLLDSPILSKISAGNFEIVARPGLPGVYSTAQYCGQPRAGAEFVYWPVQLAGQGISTAPFLAVYNVLTGALAHLPNQDATDFGTQLTGDDYACHRNVGVVGSGAGFAWRSGSAGTVQFQTNSAGSFAYMASGWVVGSKLDFGTPGVPKRFRRIEAHHAPLNAGESLTLRAFLDQDPIAFTTALTPVPSTATTTNSTQGSASTVLSIASNQSVGRSLYYAAQLVSNGQTTTPRIIYVAVEVGGTFVWDLDLNCTATRRLLNQGAEDTQGVNGKDLYFMIRNAYENGTPLTLYLAGGVSYAVNIESFKGQSFSYANHAGTAVKADEEWLVHLTLRQEAS